MRGTYFGAKPFDPCPACGTERVLLDYDDDAYIVPVVWEDVETCDGEVYIEAWSEFIFWRKWDQVRGTATCPKCGGLIEWIERRLTSGRAASPCYAIGRCAKGREPRKWREIEGCPQCRETHSHIPLHDD